MTPSARLTETTIKPKLGTNTLFECSECNAEFVFLAGIEGWTKIGAPPSYCPLCGRRGREI